MKNVIPDEFEEKQNVYNNKYKISNDILINIGYYLQSKYLLNFIKINKYLYNNNNLIYYNLLKKEYYFEKRKCEYNNNIKNWKKYYYNFHLKKKISPKYFIKNPLNGFIKNLNKYDNYITFDTNFNNDNEKFEIIYLLQKKLNNNTTKYLILLINNENKLLLKHKFVFDVSFFEILFFNNNFMLISRRSKYLEKRNYIFNRKELKLEDNFYLPDAIEDIVYNEKENVIKII
jgi:hypothetical protein